MLLQKDLFLVNFYSISSPNRKQNKLCFLSLDQEVMQDSKSNSVNGNPFTETGIPWLRFFFFFFGRKSSAV